MAQTYTKQFGKICHLKIYLTFDVEISLGGIVLQKNLYTCEVTCTELFIAGSFIIIDQKQLHIQE
jgi:hypothetical protein